MNQNELKHILNEYINEQISYEIIVHSSKRPRRI